MADLPQFLTLDDVAEILKTSQAQVYALVRRKELKAMRIGGRGQWRVSVPALQDYIEQAHRATEEHIDKHPFSEKEPVGTDSGDPEDAD